MGSKMINTHAMIVLAIVVFLILLIIIFGFKPKGLEPHDPVQAPVISVPELKQSAVTSPYSIEDDEAAQKDMRDQMEKDRNQQRRIKMLKMQLEQVNLQLDNEKALTEINKLKKENAGYVKDSSPQAINGFPNIRIIYIAGTDMDKEAILSIDGSSYSVKEKDRPIANMQILSVTNQGVKVHFDVPRKIETFINYVQE
jgi:hypothetical protein